MADDGWWMVDTTVCPLWASARIDTTRPSDVAASNPVVMREEHQTRHFCRWNGRWMGTGGGLVQEDEWSVADDLRGDVRSLSLASGHAPLFRHD
jgi:hypothetical protein